MRFLEQVPRILWLATPVMVAAALHIVVLRLRLLERLKTPLDLGRTFRGRRIFGDHKTWRGALVYVGASTLAAMAQGLWRLPEVEYFDYAAAGPALVGLLLGLGFVLGELPNSFLKRRWDVAPGARGSAAFVLLDQVDSLIGCLLLLCLVWVPPLEVWLVTLLLCSFVHMAFNAVFVLVGLKRSVF